jgi:hypothetical protein
MKTIWKYTLLPQCVVEMPVGAEILSIQSQYGNPRMWVLVDDAAPTEKRFFESYATGAALPDNPGKYIATFQVDNLVFHVFELI